jgi:type I restriction enzyme S subunit
MVEAEKSTKPSGIPWLGEVPAHWEVKRADAVLEEQRTMLQPESFVGREVFHYSIPSIQETGDGSVEEGETIASAKTWITKEVLLVSKLNPRKGTVLIGRPREQLTVCSGEFIPLVAVGCDLRYAEYVYRSEEVRQQMDAAVRSVTRSHQRAASEDIRKVQWAWPPLPEQRAIAAFLDERTARIDRLMARKRRLVQLLKEKRQALITRAVTRGLDPKVKMKESGVPWLGVVPEHWVIEKFFRIVNITEGQVNPEVEPYIDMLLIAPNHIESRTGKLIARETSAEQAAESGKYLCPDGAVVYSKIRPALRKATMAPEACLCSADMYPMVGVKGMTNGYLLWLLLCDSFSQWVVLDSERVAMPKVNRETMNAYWLPLPPVPEQEAIVAFITEQNTRIDGLVTKVEAATERLQEYRTALISAAVTGKVRVPNINS